MNQSANIAGSAANGKHPGQAKFGVPVTKYAAELYSYGPRFLSVESCWSSTAWPKKQEHG